PAAVDSPSGRAGALSAAGAAISAAISRRGRGCVPRAVAATGAAGVHGPGRCRAAVVGRADAGLLLSAQSVHGPFAVSVRLRSRAQPLRARDSARSRSRLLPAARAKTAANPDADRGAVAARVELRPASVVPGAPSPVREDRLGHAGMRRARLR